MHILGQDMMTAEQVIDTQVSVPKREDIIKKDTAARSVWQPISHSAYVKALYEGIEHNGLEVLESTFATNRTGHLLVGGFKVRGDCLPSMPNGLDAEYELFTRHANDMSVSAQVNAGVNLMVCTNGTMTGEQLARHKHTSGFDVQSWARDEVIKEFASDCRHQVDELMNLREIEMSNEQAEHFFINLQRHGNMPCARVFDAIDEWYNPVFGVEAFPLNTAYKAYGDATHVAQKCSANTQMHILQEAMGILKTGLGIAAEPALAGVQPELF